METQKLRPGLGKAMALHYSRLGAKVMISSRRLNILEQAAKDIQQATGNECHFCSAAVRIPSEVTLLADQTIDKMGIYIHLRRLMSNVLTCFYIYVNVFRSTRCYY